MPRLSEDHKEELKQFERQVANHQLTIIRDEGTYRHLSFKGPDTTNQYFDIVTWPGTLCYNGDMGTYVFSRLTDMFEFFRGGHDKYQISYGYWAEKLQAIDKPTGVSEFSPRLFKENIKDRFDSWAESLRDGDDNGESERLIANVWQQVEDEVLYYADDNEYAAQQAAYDFSHSAHTSLFQDFYEYDCTEYTYPFLWCCWALRWGIALYDTTKDNSE